MKKNPVLLYKKLDSIVILFIITILIFGSSTLSSIGINFKDIANQTFTDDDIISNPKIITDFSTSNLFFIKNMGQFSNEVLFQSYVQDANIYFCKSNVVTVFTDEKKYNQIIKQDNCQINRNHKQLTEPQNFEMISIVAEFVDANPETVVIGQNQLSHKNNYFIGNNPEQWYTDVPNYQSIIYQDIYTGIDLKYYYHDRFLKYDFIVNPGADPSQIKIQYQGAENIELTLDGKLKIKTRLGSIQEKRPVIYQQINDVKYYVQGDYLLNNNMFSFLIEDSYNKNYPLFIDPGLVYSTFLGGTAWEYGSGITVDSNGCAYVTGQTTSIDFPIKNPYSGTYNGNIDAFVTKFSPLGNSLEFSTYLGGTDCDCGMEIVIDDNNCPYIAGYTYSNDFPTVNPYDDTLGGKSDVLVVKLSSSGNELVFSTYLGGNYGENDGKDFGNAIEVDNSECIYVAGYTFCYDFPVEKPYDSTYDQHTDIFLTKFSSQGNTLEYSTYLGGYYPDECWGIAVDSSGCAYLTGVTWSDFPMQNPYDDTPNGAEEAYITKFSSEGNTLVYSTYLGGAGEEWGWSIAVDSSGCAYATGFTGSSDFPTMNAYDDTYNGGYSDVYVTKFSPEGDSLEYSTYIGGNSFDDGVSVTIDGEGCAYVTGGTKSINYPVVNSYDGTYNGDYDVYVTKISPQGNKLKYSTYLGGSQYDVGHGIFVDSIGFTYVFGYTRSEEFPTVDPYDGTYNGDRDLFLTKFPEDGGSNAPITPEKPSGRINGKVGKNYTYTSRTTDPQSDDIYYLFDWGDGNNSSWVGPYESGEKGKASHTWESNGDYIIKVKAKDVNGDVSDWSDPLSVIMPKTREISYQWYNWFLERFPLLERLLNLIR